MSSGKPLVCLKWFHESLDHDTSGVVLIIWTAPSASLIIHSVQKEFSSHAHLEVFFREHLSDCWSHGEIGFCLANRKDLETQIQFWSCICQVAKALRRTKRVRTCAVQCSCFRVGFLFFCLIISMSALQAVEWILSC